MKNIFLIIFSFFIGFQVIAQEESVLDDDKVYSLVQQKASPKEGVKKFYENFISEFKVADISNETNEIKVRMKFVVEKDGSFSNIEVIDDKNGVKNEAIRVLTTMPAWNAAQHNGKLVRSSFVLPINIKVKSKISSDEDSLKTTEGVAKYLDSLGTHKIISNSFEFFCNCNLIQSKTHESTNMEEFSYAASDNSVFYSIGLKTVNTDKLESFYNGIKEGVEKQKGTYKEVKYNDKKAFETFFSVSDGSTLFYYKTIYFIEGKYFVGLNVISSNTQIMNSNYEHLLKTFKLKI
ncbi:hypothetical protein H1R17_06525 [Flavobacterium sp. xlx-214]|uniref:energy transducer TonB n=1 Tax=unclassified Flavobacterium TaxID=196869 RepID=UPI0013D73D4F|nr:MULTISPECIES: hypothetical protein [unclassified Flavobacterium]MBA5792895.1 hypothetical protein [Flavobacterium sp. xlx-221]QMI84771.1 hypothetical protein H1R17_06525 [Flavobacterium sp. xlx-214]